MNQYLSLLLVALLLMSISCAESMAQIESGNPPKQNVFRRDNLVAWCIVPFDGKKRGPADRAAMVKRLGFTKVAYDWRENHVATFEQEILEYKKHGLDYFAFWATHPEAFRLFEKHQLHPQIWQMMASPEAENQTERVKKAAEQLLPLVVQTRKLGSKLGLYNHGGWSGEPENLVAVCKYLHQHENAKHVGIVYNQHHAHHRIDDFEVALKLMQPYLLCLNLNGLTRNGDKNGSKILPLGEGEFDVQLMKTIKDSGYQGPIGIIGHTQDDVEQRLQDNLDGLDWILPQLSGKPAGPKPKLRTWSPKPKSTDNSKLESAPILPDDARETVSAFVKSAARHGNPLRGLMVFSSTKTACLSCHKLGKHGGSVGPELTSIAKERTPAEIIESVLWPKRHVKPEYNARMFVTDEGLTHQGYVVRRDEKQVVLIDHVKKKNSRSMLNKSKMKS